MLSMIAAGAPLLASAPAFAAYGDSANVFGKITNTSGFVPYAGENFAVLLPSKWNPSKERDFDGVALRCGGAQVVDGMCRGAGRAARCVGERP